MKKTNYAGLFVIGALSLAGCGKDQTRATVNPVSQVQMGSVPGAKPVPTGKSVAAVNPWLIGNYTYARSGCMTSSGMMIPTYPDSTAPTEALHIQDTAFTREVYDSSSDCDIVASYSIVGLDTQTIVLGNQHLTVTKGGVPDSSNACASLVSAFPSVGNITLEYSYDYSGLSIFSAPTDPCQADEKNDTVFNKQ